MWAARIMAFRCTYEGEQQRRGIGQAVLEQTD